MLLRSHGHHRGVGSAGKCQSGPPARLAGSTRTVVVVLFLLPLGLALLSPEPTGTRALFTSRSDSQTNTIKGGEWPPPPPAACGTGYAKVVYGTPGDDVLHGGNQSQIIIGLGGDDTIYAGNSGDCLVGGDGNDKLYGGNAKDILIGGPGNDYLNGNNGVDTLDGGVGTDTCVGGHAPDATTNCESTP
jgi:hypothetical protein